MAVNMEAEYPLENQSFPLEACLAFVTVRGRSISTTHGPTKVCVAYVVLMIPGSTRCLNAIWLDVYGR